MFEHSLGLCFNVYHWGNVTVDVFHCHKCGICDICYGIYVMGYFIGRGGEASKA